MVNLFATTCVLIFSLLHPSYGIYTGPFHHPDWISLDLNPENETFSNETASFVVDVLVVLNVNNINSLKTSLQEISDPRSINYGNLMTMEQVSLTSSPPQEDFEKVVSWLNATGVLYPGQITWNKFKDMIVVQGTVEQLETVFETKLKWHGYINDEITKKFLRAATPMPVPSEVENIISFISLNIPIFTNNPTKPKIDVKPYPPKGYLKVWGTGDGALVRFSFYCWNSTMKAEICDGKHTPLQISIAVTDNESNFPSAYFDIPFKDITCTHLNKTGKNRIPCEPTNTSQLHADCQCAAIVGPLPLYKQLDFQAWAVSEISPGVNEQNYIGRTPQAAVLLEFTTPKLLREVYGLPSAPVQNGATMATIEFVQSFDNADIHEFMELMGLPKVGIADYNIVGNFNNTPTVPGGESILDVEYMLAMAPNASLTYYAVADCYPYCQNEGFLQWLFYIGCQEKPEQVQSLSYGRQEFTAVDATLPGALEILERIDFEFVKLGLIGTTIVTSSGDNGVCGAQNPLHPRGCAQSVPEWPVTSPYVVAVGATQLSDKYSPVCGSRWSSFFNLSIQCTGNGEVACQSDQGCVVTTGGGFSNFYTRPYWQEKAVSNFLEVGSFAPGYPTDEEFFNKQGRAYPDVAVFGSSYATLLELNLIEFCGTSASAPFFAAFLTMLNDRLLGEGLSPVGFVTPLLYYLAEEQPEVFNDITMGNNACRVGQRMGVTPLDCNDQYFSTTSGWDPVTGLGSLHFELLARAAINVAKERLAERTATQGPEPTLFPYVLPMLWTNPLHIFFPYVLPMILAFLAFGVSARTYFSLHRNEQYVSLNRL